MQACVRSLPRTLLYTNNSGLSSSHEQPATTLSFSSSKKGAGTLYIFNPRVYNPTLFPKTKVNDGHSAKQTKSSFGISLVNVKEV